MFFIDIMFAEAFLGEETGPTPSPASKSDYLDNKIRWLVEMRRPTTVTRFSGTLLHTTAHKHDLQSMTIFAFAHFVWRHSNNKMVFADIQGRFLWTFQVGLHLPIARHSNIS
jgi:Alpha-kinase family